MKTEGNQDLWSPPLHSRRRTRRNKKPSRFHRPRNQQQMVWVPAIPSWEKEFCLKIGLFKWEKFLEAKRYINIYDKVLQWDDSAGEEAFNIAKSQFFAAKKHPNDHQHLTKHPDDLYIDEIKWDTEHDDDPELYDDFPDSIIGEQEYEEEEQQGDKVPDIFNFSIEDIKPTGWDVDVSQSYDFLRGLVVGN